MNFLGAILLTLGAYSGGVIIAKGQGDKLKALSCLTDFLEYTHRRISLVQAPLYGIFTDYSDDFLEKVGFLPLLRSNRCAIKQSWISAVELLDLEETARQELLILGRDLGELPLPEQEKRISACLQAIKKEKEATERALPQKQKSTRTVALLIGAMTAILLV